MAYITDNLKRVGWLAVAVVIATFLDFLVHLASERFAVPEYYFSNKIIFAEIWFLFSLVLGWRIRSLVGKAAFIAVFTAIVLQTRYFLEGYPLWFVFGFMVVHAVAFFLSLYVVLRFRPKLFNVRR